MGQRAVGIGAGQQHEHVGPGGEGAPRLDAVDHPPALDRRGRRHDAGDVGAEVGLGHGDRGQDLGRGQLGQPLLLLLLGAAVDEGPGQDLGPGDERAADAERAPAQLLGGDDHAHVVALAAGGEAAVLLGDREPEAAELGQALDDLLGDVDVLAVHVLGVGADLVLGEAVERLAHQLEVLAEVPGPLGGGQAGQHGRIALGREEGRRRRVPAGLDAPAAPPGRPPGRRGRPRRRPRRQRQCGPRPLPVRRTRAWPAPWPPRRPRAPRRRRPPGWRRCRPRSRTEAQAWSTRRWARSTASAAPARSGAGGVVTGSDPNGSPKCPSFRPRLGAFRRGGR